MTIDFKRILQAGFEMSHFIGAMQSAVHLKSAKNYLEHANCIAVQHKFIRLWIACPKMEKLAHNHQK
jgi:hypothetical protein